MIRAGVPQSVAMSISGHKTVSMFGRCNITSNTDRIEALRKTAEHLAIQQTPNLPGQSRRLQTLVEPRLDRYVY
jgi:hypothetical protein